ncbi:DUF3789 domain-containing protein [Enterococcus faecalis]|nr:DUF3789 domain-containing protein [Enterococcus faecalis]
MGIIIGILSFVLGGFFGVGLMCLLQINRLSNHTDL